MCINESIRWAIKPLVTYSNCFYLLIFSVTPDGIVMSRLKAVASIFFVIAYSAIKHISISTGPHKDLEDILLEAADYAILAFCLASCLNFQFYAKTIARTWNKILTFSVYVVEESYYKKAFLIGCLQVGVYNALFVLSLTFYYYFNSHVFQEKIMILEAFADYFMLMHFCGTITFFTNGLLFCRKVISVANGELLKLRKIEKYKENHRWSALPSVRVEKIKELRSQMKMIRNEDLSRLVDVYENVFGCLEKLNECFGISLLASCVNNAMEMAVSCYLITKHGLIALKLFSLWLSFCFTFEVTLVSVCEKFLKETEKTRRVLNFVVTENSSQVLKESVQRFSHHLLLRPVKFTACRLFDLNYPFLFSVISVIVTYLVIIVQFDKKTPKHERLCFPEV